MAILDRTDYEVKDAIRRIRTQAYLALCEIWGVAPNQQDCQGYIDTLTFKGRP